MIPFPYVLRRRMMASGGGSKDMASLAPASGITYTSGLTGLTAADVSAMAALISNEPTITKDTLSSVYVDYGDIHRKFDIANQVTLSLNGTNYAFDILGFNHDTLTTATAYGESTATGKAGITLQMHTLFATTYQTNTSNTNVGGWKSCLMRTSTMPTMKGYLPQEWQSIIKAVNKTSGVGGGSTSGTETVSDSCFLLAEIEIFGNITRSVSGEGFQYAYYKAGNSTIKYKQITSTTTSASGWRERSPSATYSNQFCGVTANGSATASLANVSIAIAPAFCV